MSLDNDPHLGIGAQELSRLREGITRVGANICLIIVEEGVFHVPVEQLL
jgi:hypothetical protein